MPDFITPDIVAYIAYAAVLAIAVKLMRAVDAQPEDVNKAINFAGAVVRSLEEAYPGSTIAGEAKLNEALARVQDRFGIDRELAAVYVQAAVSGLRQAGIKPQHQATQLAQVAASRALQDALNASAQNGSTPAA